MPADKAGARLEFSEVHFSYGQKPILKGLSFSVGPGELVGFLGVNGSGKTTTFLLATGFLQASSGQITIAGCAPRQSKKWCLKVGVLHAGAGHYQRLSVRRNLSFFASLYGLRPDLDAHLEANGLKEVADKQAGKLSTGYKQRLSLARATIHSPELLLLDEPSDGLDPAATDRLHKYLREFTQKGGSVLLTTHRIEEVEALCHRVIMLSDGVASYDGGIPSLAEGDSLSLRERLLKLANSS